MKNYNFIKFDGTYPRGDSMIAINRSGLVRLSSGFCRATNITQFAYTLLFFDKSNNAIAFKFTNKSEMGTLKVTKDKTGATVSGKSFFGANKLNLDKYSGRYEWKKQVRQDIGEIYIIDLK